MSRRASNVTEVPSSPAAAPQRTPFLLTHRTLHLVIEVSNRRLELVRWWKDRDSWMPGVDLPPTYGGDEEFVGDEDIGDIADDDEPDASESNDLPDRGPDQQ